DSRRAGDPRVNRRAFLRRSVLLGAAGLAGGADAAPGDAAPAGLAARVGFTGAHQAGIVTPPAEQATVTALDAIAADRAELAGAWTVDGFLGADRGGSARRNLFGFHDGTANPAGGPRDAVVWQPGGGTFQVVRTIRMHTEFWDRVGLREQEQLIGRRRDTGA